VLLFQQLPLLAARQQARPRLVVPGADPAMPSQRLRLQQCQLRAVVQPRQARVVHLRLLPPNQAAAMARVAAVTALQQHL
jgi:hypothetical protein